ncbi:MAG: D-alanyl-D-alanine carboxypeptidase family protein [Bacillota bacterium]
MKNMRKKLAVILVFVLALAVAADTGTPWVAFAEEDAVVTEETASPEEIATEPDTDAEAPELDAAEPEEVYQTMEKGTEPAVNQAETLEPIKTVLSDVTTSYNKSYKTTLTDTVNVYPAFGRTVELYLYDPYFSKWVLQQTFVTGDTETADVVITYPAVWKSYSESNWKIVCPQTDEYTEASQTVKIRNKIANAKAAVIMDAKTGKVIYAQNARAHLKIASMTKMVTMMVVADRCKFSKRVKITSEAVTARKKSGGMGLRKGDVILMKDLVHATLMESANDAAAAAACGVSGSQKKFAKLMTQKAKSIGATESTFKLAYGDWHSNTYSTAYDQALIGRAFMTNPKYSQLRTIVKKRSYTFKTKKKKRRYTVRMGGMSTSLIKNGRSIGIKSGYNPPAGYCYANAWNYKGRTYISIVMGASSSKTLVSSQKALMTLSDYLVDNGGSRIKVK